MQLLFPTHELIESQQFLKSFFEAQKELDATKDDRYSNDVPRPKTMKEYVDTLLAHSRGENLPNDWVSYSTFWLIDNDEFIGDTHIRHTLNDHLRNIGGHIGYTIRPSKRKQGYGTKILKLALIEAKKLGIDFALITCDETNIGSKKIIEKNGGIFEKASEQSDGHEKKLLYWIKIS